MQHTRENWKKGARLATSAERYSAKMDFDIACILTKHYMAFYVWLSINFWEERDTYYQNIKIHPTSNVTILLEHAHMCGLPLTVLFTLRLVL